MKLDFPFEQSGTLESIYVCLGYTVEMAGDVKEE